MTICCLFSTFIFFDPFFLSPLCSWSKTIPVIIHYFFRYFVACFCIQHLSCIKDKSFHLHWIQSQIEPNSYAILYFYTIFLTMNYRIDQSRKKNIIIFFLKYATDTFSHSLIVLKRIFLFVLYSNITPDVQLILFISLADNMHWSWKKVGLNNNSRNHVQFIQKKLFITTLKICS